MQNSALTGRSGWGLPPRLTGRFGAAAEVPPLPFMLAPVMTVPLMVAGTPAISVPIVGAAAVLIAVAVAVLAVSVVCQAPEARSDVVRSVVEDRVHWDAVTRFVGSVTSVVGIRLRWKMFFRECLAGSGGGRWWYILLLRSLGNDIFGELFLRQFVA